MEQTEQEKLAGIAGHFDIREKIISVGTLGEGLINDTYVVRTEGTGPDYVLQRINHNIFRDIDLLQRNIDTVTGHIRKKLQEAGEKDVDRKVLRFIPIKEGGRSYCLSDGNYWRLSVLIEGSVTKSAVDTDSSYDSGRAFGNFESMLADLKEPIGETIPDFHNMELRSRQLKEAVAADRAGRMAMDEVRRILDTMNEYDAEMCKAERMFREGVLPKRICHCDPKLSNILFDTNLKVLCVIDLDTVMPSFVFSDFGDFLRTGANTVAEDCPDIASVDFRMDIYEAFREGYLETADFLSDIEKENLPYAARLFPYMQAVRFFTDYINGDSYYKTAYPEHNLVRTRNQMALFESASKKLKR